MQHFYFDHNATNPVAPEVLRDLTATLVEVSGNDVVVHVSVVDGTAGVELGSKDYTVPAGNEIVAGATDILGTVKASNVYFRFSVASGSGAVIAYGIATDTVSGDPTLVIARKDP